MKTLEQIGRLTDVGLELEVELDRKTMTVGEVLDLDKGALIRLNRSAGENIDISVGGSVLAYGEIVIIEDMMGVRITDFRSED